MLKKPLSSIAIVTALFVLGGCALPRAALKDTASTLVPIKALDHDATAGLDNRDVIVQTEVQPFFIASELEASDPLPDIRVSGISFSTSSIYEVMRTVLAKTNLSFSINSENAGGLIQRRNISAVNVSGSLKDILDGLSNSLGIYYNYHNGVISISPDRQFVVMIPPVDEVLESLPPMLRTLGGTDVYLDKPGRTIAFRASQPSFRRINSYLDYVRSTKKLIVYDVHIWEVMLNDDNSTGIQWNSFSWLPLKNTAVNISGGAPGAAGALGVAAVYNSSKLAIDVLASFLQTQGNLKTVSQPKLTLISGGKSIFRVGNTTNYVSQIGSTVANNATSTTVQTSQVLSGLDLTLAGDISDGTVFTDVKLNLNDLQRFNTFTAMGTVLSLPQTANRSVETKIRSRAGDTIMLAGINIEKNSHDVSGLPGAGNTILLPMTSDQALQRSELVIVLRPHIIRFGKPSPTDAAFKEVDVTPTEEKNVAPAPAPVSTQEKAESPND